MPMRVRLSQPRLLAELVESFNRNDCVAHRADDETCAVVHVHANDPAEAWTEVAFFLRAWQQQHPGVTAVMTGS